jgi:lipopolysaccharide export system permease protein
MKKINSYLAKNFSIRFLQITIGFSLLIFLINFIDNIERIREANSPFFIAILLSFLQIPDFINDIAASLILIASIITFYSLSLRSEISIIRVSGYSLWQIAFPIAFSAFLIGCFWISFFNLFSAFSLNKFQYLEAKYINYENHQILAPSQGIWIKQNNLENENEEIIIQAKSAIKENLEFRQITFWFFDENGNFYKKIDGKKAFLKKGFWHINQAILNYGDDILNKEIENLDLQSALDQNFVSEKILNNAKNIKLFSIFQLPKLIGDLKSAGLPSTKFSIYLNSLLIIPILFPAMTLIACFFGLNHIRSNNSHIMIFIGIIIGLILYITSSIITALGASNLIPIFSATWLVAIISLAVGILLIYKKELV